MISGNMVGSYSQIGKTFILVDEDGNEITGVCVDNPVVFTANASEDIRAGKVAATDAGVVTGSVIIPNYETSRGNTFITPGSNFAISSLKAGNKYDYRFLQCIVTLFESSVNNSVLVEYVVIGDAIYTINTNSAIATLTKNHDTKSIDFNIINNSENTYIIRYVTYKEVL